MQESVMIIVMQEQVPSSHAVAGAVDLSLLGDG